MKTHKWTASSYIGHDGWAAFRIEKILKICSGYGGNFDFILNPLLIGSNYE
jgi:hypothetical protein